MNNEEKILAILAQIQDKLEQHDEMFAEQGKKLDSIDTRLKKVEFTQENRILPSLRVLAEGQSDLLEQLASKESVAEIRSSVNLALTGIKTHSSQITALTERVAKLEKAN